MPLTNTGNIALAVIPQANGRYLCKATPLFDGRTGPTRSFHGQTSSHAIALALEDLARQFRIEAEAEQNIAWDEVERSPSGKVREKRFHVILHYETIIDEESKFEARNDILMGNTVIENAETSIIQVDPMLPIKPWKRRGKVS